MRLLVFSTNGAYSSSPAVAPSAGGAEHALRWTAETAAAAGHHVVYVTIDPATPSLNLSPSVPEVDVDGVRVRFVRPFAIPRLGGRLLARREALLLAELSTVLERFDPDVAFTYAPAPDTWLVVQARERTGSRVRVVERVSGRPWEQALLRGGDEASRVRTAFTHRDATLYSSRSVRDYTLAKLAEYDITPAGTAHIADLSPEPAPAQLASLPPEVARLFAGHAHALSFVGRFKPRSKRQDVAVAVLAELARRDVDACIAFAGDGRLLDQIREQAEQLGVSDRCCFAGYLSAEQVAAMVEASELGLLLTDFEGNSKAAIEYIRRETPCVMSDIPPNAEILEDQPRLGELLLTQTSAEAVADRIEALVSREDELEAARRLTSLLAEQLAFRLSPTAFVDTLLNAAAQPVR